MDVKISMNVSIMVVIPMQTVSTPLVVSNAHVRQDSVEMDLFASILMNVNCQIHADLKDHDVSIQPDHSDAFVAKDSEVSHILVLHI